MTDDRRTEAARLYAGGLSMNAVERNARAKLRQKLQSGPYKRVERGVWAKA